MVYSNLDDLAKYVTNFKISLKDKIGTFQWNSLKIDNHNEICYNNVLNIIKSLTLCYEPTIKKLEVMSNSSNPEFSKDLIKRIDDSFRYANNNESKINQDILDIEGMSGIKSRHFFNNICSYDGTRYLEIGSFRGSTFSSALYNNKIKAVSIDNWSEFGDQKPKECFLDNLEKYKGSSDVEFIEKDCWEVDVKNLPKFNIYFYDGHHSEESQFKALTHYTECLDEQFILIVDDWNWKNVRDGTFRGLNTNNMKIIYQYEVYTNMDNQHSALAFKNSQWHNGLVALVIQK
tara:strand:- start:110 stop:976 length:867 start_codon:yes stop_codon:yes gene_type:complete